MPNAARSHCRRRTQGSLGGFDSPFEEAVAEQLAQRGWAVTPQVGISGFRIDLGIRHPDLDGTYLAGVECDGATYHQSSTARDRDKVREQVLSGLGWNMLRVWSTDWWFDKTGCADRLHASLEDLLHTSRERQAAEARNAQGCDAAAPEDGSNGGSAHDATRSVETPPYGEIAPSSIPAESGLEASYTPVRSSEPHIVEAPSQADAEASPAARLYRVTDLSGFATNPDQFFDFAYRDVLRRMVEAVIETESPLRADVLAQRIARAHGWLRTGGRIRERIDLHLRGVQRSAESSGEFVWKAGSLTEFLPYRPPANLQAQRPISDVPLAELAALVLENPGLLDEPDPARELASLLGVERLAATSRSRLDEAIARAGPHVAAQSTQR